MRISLIWERCRKLAN